MWGIIRMIEKCLYIPITYKEGRTEREGFEPSVPEGTHDFQSCPIGLTLAPLP